MLTFYPEFEADNISENEVVFLLDLSNSMKVSASDRLLLQMELYKYHALTLA